MTEWMTEKWLEDHIRHYNLLTLKICSEETCKKTKLKKQSLRLFRKKENVLKTNSKSELKGDEPDWNKLLKFQKLFSIRNEKL